MAPLAAKCGRRSARGASPSTGSRLSHRSAIKKKRESSEAKMGRALQGVSSMVKFVANGGQADRLATLSSSSTSSAGHAPAENSCGELFFTSQHLETAALALSSDGSNHLAIYSRRNGGGEAESPRDYFRCICGAHRICFLLHTTFEFLAFQATMCQKM